MRKTRKNNNCRKSMCFIFSVLLLAALFAACEQPTNGGGSKPTPGDNTRLVAEIAKAENAKTGIRTAPSASAVPQGIFWVTQDVMTTFNAAIAAATSVRNNTAATQAAIDAARSTLAGAISAFLDAVKEGTATPVDLTALAAKIIDAENAKRGVASAADGSTVSAGSFWVTQTVMSVFDTAITAAETVRDNATSQAQVDAAITTLQAAITTFNAAKREGTQTSGFTAAQLTELISRANTDKQGVAAGADPNSFGPQDRFVDANVLTALEAAITAAGSANDSNRDALYGALNSALTAFNAAVQTGTIPDKTALNTVINSVDTAKAGVVTAADRASAPKDSRWATEAQIAALDTAKAAALAVSTNGNASLNAVDEAFRTLNEAIGTFNSAVTNNGPGEFVTEAASVTITGFTGYPDTAEIVYFGLTKSNTTNGNAQPEIFGEAIRNGTTLSADLYSTETSQPWGGNGSWYISFGIKKDDTPSGFEVWVSNAIHNFSATPKPTLAFSAFKKVTTFTMTFDDMSNGNFAEYVPGGSISLDGFIGLMSGGEYDYEEWMDLQSAMLGAEVKMYKNEAKTVEFSGSDTISASTVIYLNSPYWMMGGENPIAGDTVGTITGTITLTSVPAGATVYIRAEGYISNSGGGSSNYWNSYETKISGTSGGGGTSLAWSIPISEDNLYDPNRGQGFTFGENWETEFRLYIRLMNGNSYNVSVPGSRRTVNIAEPDGTANVGNIGTADAGIVVLSGTVNITYDNAPVPSLQLSARIPNYGSLGWTNLRTPAPNTPWTMTIPKSSTARNVSIDISVYPRNGNALFQMEVPIGEIPANQGKTNINLNIGNVTPGSITLRNMPSGTYTIYSVQDTSIGPDNYQSIADGTSPYINGRLDGSGPSVSASALSISSYSSYSILIKSGDDIRYTSSSVRFPGGTGIIDWDTLSRPGSVLTLTGSMPPNSYIQSVYVFNTTADLSGYDAVSSAVNNNGVQVARGYHNGNQRFILNIINSNAYWTGNGSFPVVLNNAYGNSDSLSNPRYWKGTITFSNGLASVALSAFTPVAQGNANNAAITINLADPSQDIMPGWEGSGVSDGTPYAPDIPVLANGTLTNGEITGDSGNRSYQFYAQAGTTYTVRWNDNYRGDGTQSLDVEVKAYWHDTSSEIFGYEDSGWDPPKTFTPTQSGIVVVEVAPYSSGGTGTYQIQLSHPAVMPPVILVTGDFTVSVSGTGYSGYKWLLDGVTLAGRTASAITVDTADLSLGKHRLTVTAMKGGAPYSREISFRIDG